MKGYFSGVESQAEIWFMFNILYLFGFLLCNFFFILIEKKIKRKEKFILTLLSSAFDSMQLIYNLFKIYYATITNASTGLALYIIGT